jgi:hypothetical protein
MNSADMFSLVPNPDDLLARSIEERGRLILQLLRESDTPDKAVAHSNFFNRANDFAASPSYGSKQREVDNSLMEAWTWLESEALLTKKPSSGGASWSFVSGKGKEFLERNTLFERLERLGLDRVRSDLMNNDGRRTAHRGKELDTAWEWVRMKENGLKTPVEQDVAKQTTTETTLSSRKVFVVHGHDEGAREMVAPFLRADRVRAYYPA